MRRGVFLMLIHLLVSAHLVGQEFPQDIWYRGSVTFNDGTTKEGIINYDLDANAIRIEIDQKVETYHANQFRSYSIYQEEENFYRNFYVLQHANSTNYRRPTVFELINEGEVSLLAREYIATRSDNTNSSFFRNSFGGFGNPYAPVNTITTRYLAFNLFLVDNRGKVTALSTNKKAVISAFGAHQKELKKFIKENKLKMDRVMHMSRLVDYFNQLNAQ